MAIDPNLYAVQIELGMDASAAFNDLSTLEQSITGLETRLQGFMAKFALDVSSTFKDLNSSVESLGKSLYENGVLDRQQKSVSADMLDIHSQINDLAREREQHQSVAATTLVGMLETNSEINNLTKEQEQYQSAIATTLTEMLETNSEINKIAKDQEQLNIKHHDFSELLLELQKQLLDIDKSIAEIHVQRNAAAQELLSISGLQSAALSNIEGSYRKSGAAIDSNNQGSITLHQTIIGIRDTVSNIARGFDSIIGPLAAVTKGTEDFVTVNFRAYGAVHALLSASERMSAEMAFFGAATREAFRELMNIKIPLELIEEYTVTVVKAGRVTGASNRTLVEYIKSMQNSTAGFKDANEIYKQATHSLSILAYAQQKYNLSAAEIDRILQIQTEKMSELRYIYGDEFPESIGVSLAMMSKMAKEAGESGKAMEDMAKIIQSTGIDAIQFSGIYGEKFAQGAEGRFEAIIDKTAEFADSMEAARQAGYTGEELNVKTIDINNQASEWGITAEMIRSVTDAKKRAAEQGLTLQEVLAAERAEIQKNADLNKAYQESLDSIYAAYEGLRTQFGAVLQYVVEFIAQGLVPLLQYLTMFMQKVVGVIKSIKEWWTETEKMYPSLQYVRKGLSMLIGVFIIGTALITGFSLALGGLRLVLGNLRNPISTFFNGTTALIRAFSQTLIAFARGVGTAIGVFGRSIAPAIIPLMGLGVALLIVAASAYVFAKAVSIMIDAGDGAIVTMLAMAVILGVLTAALVALAYLAAPATPVILGIAVAVLAVGAAALLAGYGVKLMGEGIKMVVDSITADSIANLALLTVEIAALALVAGPSTLTLMGLSGAMYTLSWSMGKIATQLTLMSTAIASMRGTDLSSTKAHLTGIRDELKGIIGTLNGANSISGKINVLSAAIRNLRIDSTNVDSKSLQQALNAISTIKFDSISTQVNGFNNLELNSDRLVASINTAATRIKDAISMLSDPSNELATHLTEMTSKISEINRLQTELESTSATMKSVPTEEKKSQMPNEMRKVEKTVETIRVADARDKTDNSEEILSTLQKIARLLEDNNKNDEFFGANSLANYDSTQVLQGVGVRT